ncbi:MAG TPA: hypothetical protein VGB06_06810 [Solirubrobacterales bacterium]|jgi:hypothetical protein
MPLDGLRAWIGEVERKLGMRTRVFLVLAAIAIGGAGAAIYLALDTRDAAVSEGDVRALQEDLEAQIAGGGSPTGTSLSELEADLRALEAKVGEMRGETGDGPTGSGGVGAGSGSAGTGTNATPPPDTSGAVPDIGGETNGNGIAIDDPEARARLRDFLGEAAKQNETAEGDGAGG